MIVNERTTRENLYVAMTRGRAANHAYVVTDAADPASEAYSIGQRGPTSDAAAVLAQVIRASGAEPSAHQAQREEAERWESIAQWVAEYETIAQAALQEHCDSVLTAVGLTPEQLAQIREEPAYPHLVKSIADLATSGVDTKTILPELFRPAPDRRDLAQALGSAVMRAKALPACNAPRHGERLIAGVLTVPEVPMRADVRRSLKTRAKLFTDGAAQLAEQAQREHAPWLDAIGPEASGPWDKEARRKVVLAVAAYRDRYGVTGPKPLGGPPATKTQQRDRNRITLMITDLRRRTQPNPFFGQSASSVGTRPPALSL
jgi:hypothetical protein